ncbi:MAG: TIGR02996 domain-containing protein [Gemmataceae bacterium]
MISSDPVDVLLADIAHDPEDDLPRFVLGDLLADRGDPRGEFLQVEMQLHTGQLTSAQRQYLEHRRRSLLGRHVLDWLGPFADAARSWEFQRGFLHLELPAERLSLALLKNPCAAWIEQIRVLDCYFRLSDSLLEGLLRHASSLQFHEDLNLASLVGRLFRQTHSSRLRRLHLEGGMFPTPAIHRLIEGETQTRLLELTLSHQTITAHQVQLLVAGSWKNLRRLILRRCSISGEEVSQLRERFAERLQLLPE